MMRRILNLMCHTTSPPPDPLYEQEWREMQWGNMKDYLQYVRDYKPHNDEAQHLRILLHGPVSAGKSSFINSVDSVLRGRVTSRAPTDSICGSSFTKKYTTYKIRKQDGSLYSFLLNDIFGYEEESDVLVEDIKLALRGHVREGYKFSEHQLTEKDPGYNSAPSLADRAHVLVSVIPADKVSSLRKEVLRKMREIRLAACEQRIPQVAILTRVDKACPLVKDNVNNTYKSKSLKKQVDKVSKLLGLPVSCIFLVKNYNSEVNTNVDTDALILSALRQIITYGEDYLNDL